MVGRAGRLVRLDPGRVHADAHVDGHAALDRPDGVPALSERVRVGIHSGLDQFVPGSLVQVEELVHDRSQLGRGHVPEYRPVEVRHFLVVNLARLVGVGDGLDPVRIVGLGPPGPLGLANGVEVVAVPDVQAELQVGIAPLHDAVQLLVQGLVPFQPEPFVQQDFGMGQQHAQELDEGAVHKVLVGAGRLEVGVGVVEGASDPFDIQALADGQARAVVAEAGRGLP